jgi:hypothetical protein
VRSYVITTFLSFFPLLLCADNIVKPGSPVIDRPTITTLGVQLPITGDDNFNASVTVSYRAAGTPTWFTALPLFRVHPETVVGWTIQPQFAGSIFDLQPGTSYTIQLHVTDPDGPVDQTFFVNATTRPVPADPLAPRFVSVQDKVSLISALQTAQPGDVINVADGIYSGPIDAFPNGTVDNPIVIRGASQNGTIFDGGNCDSCNVWEIYGNYIHLERMTVRNAQRGVRFQTAGGQGNVLRHVRITNVIMGVGSRQDQLDFYIADNIIEGRLLWPLVYSSDGGAHAADDGIAVQGFGHVVCHNQISGFGDALKITEQGSRSMDFYNNEILWSYDNGIELDSSEGNTRAFRNRFTNTWDTLSVQPIYGGPAYLLRNVVVNAADEQMKFHAIIGQPPPSPNGVFAYHNTFISTATDLNMNTPDPSHHFDIENNLFIGPSTLPGKAVSWTGVIDDGRFDYNGYYPDGFITFNLLGSGYQNYPNFAAMQSAALFEPHGELLAQPPFSPAINMPATYTTLVSPQNVQLAPGSSAVDHGRVLPNINDGYTGTAPDLGALEVGCPQPVYGVRPQGMDERNEPSGCKAVVIPLAAVSISPSSGSGQSQTFTAVFSDPKGAADLSYVYLQFGPSVDFASSCMMAYFPVSHVMFLFNDSGIRLVPGFITLGKAGTLSNSQCTITSAGPATLSGVNLTLPVTVKFSDTFTGAKNAYGYANDNVGTGSVWIKLGTWTSYSSQAPSLISITPINGSGSNQTFRFTFSTQNGGGDISQIYAGFNSTLSVDHGCFFTYLPLAKALYLFGDVGSGFVTGPLSNSQCNIAMVGAPTTLGANMTLTVAVKFNPSFLGVKNIYAFATDLAYQYGSLDPVGTWTP